MNEIVNSYINWEKVSGLLPVIIQSNATGQVLMLGYMNYEALKQTTESGLVTFYSRTKKRLWTKGESSGQILRVVQILKDCDADSLLILADIEGFCCHLDQVSCFGNYKSNFGILNLLEELIILRFKERPEKHYTTELFDQGIKRIAQKVGEEGVEVALAATCGDQAETCSETADLLYHLLVLLVAKDLRMEDVCFKLEQRILR